MDNTINRRPNGRAGQDAARSDLPEIKAGLDADPIRALFFIMSNGYMDKQEFKCGDVYGNSGKSFGFNVDKRMGADFGALESRGYRGVYDVYVAHFHGNQRKAYQRAKEFLHLAEEDRPTPRQDTTPTTRRKTVDWFEVDPEPTTPPPNFRKLWPGVFKQAWSYRDQTGRLLFYVARYESGGKKQTPAITLGHSGDGVLHWRARGGRHILYGLELLSTTALLEGSPEVWIFEGEKTAEAARKLFPGVICLSWKGGSKSVRYTDFSPLAGYRVRFIADRDGVGEKAMKLGAELALKAGSLAVAVVTMPDHFPDGWDVADELPKGWTVDKIRARIEAAPWQGAPTPPPPRGTVEGVPAYWSASARPVAEVRPELAAAVEKAAREGVSIAIRTTPGSGKTTAEIALARKRSGWLLFAEPNHDIAGQVIADMKGFGLHLAGRGYEYAPGKTLCQIPEDAEAAHSARLNVTQELCKFCPFKGGCEYFDRLDQIKSAMKTKPAGAIVTVHNFYSQDMARDIDTDMIDRIVIDERIDLDRDTAFPADRLDRESHDVIFGRKVLDAFDGAGHLRLTGFLAEDLTHRAEVEGRSVKLKLDPEMNFEQRREAIRRHAEQLKLEFRWKFQKLFTTMAREIKLGREVSNQIVLVRNESDPKNGTTPRDYIHIYSKSNVSAKLAGKPIHYVDGTLDRHHARALLGDGCAFVALDAVRNLHVTQVCDAVFSKNHLLFRKNAKANRNRIYSFILGLGRTHRKILIGVPKTVRDVMEAEWKALVADMPEAPIVSWIHMNKGRGVNAYQDYDCAVVVGREEPRVRAIEALARQRFPDTPITPLPSSPEDGRAGPRWPTRFQGYIMKDGRKLGVEMPYHPDPLCQSILEQIREGEIVQIVDRLRGVNRQEAPSVYLLTSIPTEIPIDRLVPWRELRTETCGAKWWQQALQIGGGVAPLRWEWLVENGIFETETQAAQAVSRLARQTRQYANYNSIGLVSCFPNLTTFRTPDQHGRDSWVLIEHGMNDDDTAARLARHVGKLHSLNGRIIGAEPAAHEPAHEPAQDAAMIDDSIILDPCGYEPDEPAPEHHNVPLDSDENIRKLKETLMWISIRNTNLCAAALEGRAGLETWRAGIGADDAADLEPKMLGNIQPRSGYVSNSVLEY